MGGNCVILAYMPSKKAPLLVWSKLDRSFTRSSRTHSGKTVTEKHFVWYGDSPLGEILISPGFGGYYGVTWTHAMNSSVRFKDESRLVQAGSVKSLAKAKKLAANFVAELDRRPRNTLWTHFDRGLSLRKILGIG